MTDKTAESYECDVLVVGSGCAGLSAAVTAGHHGLKVLITEKEPRFGGTTARSGGWLWIPGTRLAKAWGIVEDKEQARTYLRHEAGTMERPPCAPPGGTYAGIKTDANARALDADGKIIGGLYAAGNDMASIMGGNYPGAGITLGPALTFGYIAGKHLAGSVP